MLPCTLALLQMGCGAGWAGNLPQKWRFADFHLLQEAELPLFPKSNSAPAGPADHLLNLRDVLSFPWRGLRCFGNPKSNFKINHVLSCLEQRNLVVSQLPFTPAGAHPGYLRYLEEVTSKEFLFLIRLA